MSHPRAFGQYQVVRQVGQGGMGRVYEVHDPALPGRRLALKLGLLDGSSPEATQRFEREALLLARVVHPNVVRVWSAGSVEGSGPYLVMDLVEGTSLDQQRRGGPLDPVQAAELVADLAGAIQAVHAQGILHRDLKPENVILRPDGTPVLLDFGIARGVDSDRLTKTGALLGSPNYMAPEQAEGLSPAQLDVRVDVYGLGTILFALLSGRPPHEGTNVIGLLQQVIVAPVRWPDAAQLGGRPLPEGLVAIGARALAKSRDERWPSAAALEAALRGWLAGDEPEAAPARRSTPWLILGLAGLGGLATAAALTLRGSPPALTPTAAPSPSAPVASQAPAPAPELGPRLVLDPPRASGPTRAAFLPGDRLLSWSGSTVAVWRFAPPERPAISGEWDLPGPIDALEPARTGRVVLMLWREGPKQRLGLLDLASPGAAPRPLPLDHPEPVIAIALEAGGSLYALAHASPRAADPPRPAVVVHRLREDGPPEKLREHAPQDPSVADLALVSERRLLVGGAGAEVAVGANLLEVVDLAPGAGPPARFSSTNLVSVVAQDPSGGVWMGNSNWEIHPVDLSTEILLPTLPGVAASQQIDRGDGLTRPPSHNGHVYAVRFAPAVWAPGGPRWVVSLSNGQVEPLDRADRRSRSRREVRVWSPGPDGEWRNVAALVGWPSDLHGLDVSPDGAWIVVGHGQQLELWRREAIPGLDPASESLPGWGRTVEALDRPR